MATLDTNTLISSLKDVSVSRYIGVAAFCLCVYDWALLIADEYELVGKSRLSLGKVLYYILRITTALGLAFAMYHLSPYRPHLSHKFCVVFVFINPTLQVVCLAASYWLLMLRIVALYKKKPLIVWLLYFALISSYVTTYGLLLRAQFFFAEYVMYIPEIGVCATTGRAPTISGVFYAPLGFDLLIFSLTVYHAWKDYRSGSDLSVVPLLRVMYRDGVMLFSIMVAMRVWNIFIYAVQPLSRTWLGIYMMWSVVTVLSSRIYLNVVQFARSKAKHPSRSSMVHSKLSSPSTDTSSPITNYSPATPFSVGGPSFNGQRISRDYFPGTYYPPQPRIAPAVPLLRVPHPFARASASHLGTMESDVFYTAYFQDQFALDRMDSHDKENVGPAVL